MLAVEIRIRNVRLCRKMFKFCALLLLATLALSSAAWTRDVRRINSGSSKNYYTAPVQSAPRTPAKYAGSSSDKDVQILRNEQEMKEDGSYHYQYETSNGIVGAEQGIGGVSVQGSSSWISPEGIEFKTTYVADENGYQPVGDHIPKTPDYILRALEYIRTHPYHEDAYSGHVKSAPTYTQKVATNISPPFSKPAAPRRITPAPTKFAFKKTPKSGNRYKF